MRCCKVDAMVSVDNRGQIVLPKDVRDRAGIKAGDKFVVMSYGADNEMCCLMLVKADDFAGVAKEVLEPMAKEILK